MKLITNCYAPIDIYFMLLLASLHSVILHVAVERERNTPLTTIHIPLCRYLNQSFNVESFVVIKTQLIHVTSI